ncbi:MAG: cysteine--tRNA ligase [Candidatus Moranbacteria bacterium]|nr:cysteine--tRNA ligase [Candidatus Moranbacteria bacterium]
MLNFYNTLSNQKEKFQPLEEEKVKMYNCGPTVYDYAHIGNWSTFVFADTLRRYLEYKGYEVRQIMNITDVGHLTEDDLNQADSGEDKMLKASKRERKTPEEIADFYTKEFYKDAKKLNLKKAHFYPKATDHIPHMIKLIEELISKGLAYEKNGNVFFDVQKFEGYGKLSGKKLDELKEGARLEEHPDKASPFDFALWLKAPKNHLMKWEGPWSVGYPGWHIECSAMSIEYLGETMDIHTGGEDHVFPHHENEIAQSEGATGKPFARFWLHRRFLLVKGHKMSKSKGKFYTLKDVLKEGFSPQAFRLLVLNSHYRSNLNFTWESMRQASANLEKIQRFIERIENRESGRGEKSKDKLDTSSHLKKFESAMDDDLNTPEALASLFEMITEVNKKIDSGRLSEKEKAEAKTAWNKINTVLGLKIDIKKQESVPAEIEKLLKERQEAKQSKDFQKADEIRDKINKMGYEIEDSPESSKVRKTLNSKP